MDLKTWLQCFAIYVGVLSAKHPEAVPELMSYMVAIIRASEEYAGLAWVRYDAAHRRQAAANNNRKWSTSLFSLCFTGKAQIANRCDLCLAAPHATKDCALVAEGDPDLPSRLKAVESAVAAFFKTGGLSSVDRRLQGPPRRTQDEVCRVWNEKRYYFRRCRFRHVCSATTPWSSACSEGPGEVRLGVPRIINRHEARLNHHSGIPTIRGEGLESPWEVVWRRQQLLDSGH